MKTLNIGLEPNPFREKIIALCLLLLCSNLVFGCTTFVLKNDSSLVFGRNLDWVSDNGVIVVNKRNISKTSMVFPTEKPTEWNSKYGSITFNQFGKEFPFGGINEKGLVVEIMLVSGVYPDYDNRTAINELQWIQYQLDNFKTIDEVIASDRNIRISKIDQNLHFLICDSFGNLAVIEFDKKGMVVYRGSDLPIPVLENDPYSESLQKNKAKTNCRFRTANNLIEQYKSQTNIPPVDYSFKILDKVALDGSWSIVYDLKKMEIHFKTASSKAIRKIRVVDFDFSCKDGSKLYDLKRKDKGNINSYFSGYSAKLNKSKLDDALKSNGLQLPKETLNYLYYIPSSYLCLKN